MGNQRNQRPHNQVIPTALHVEMEQSYLAYAMSVIIGRALPDARDGLKPVHRRILYAMHELGLTPDRPFRKCARVVGDVLGKYHPHGDQAVYDALVRMVQPFSSRFPLLAGHGNFGSVDGDPPAAMRYTETRLAPVAHGALLEDISEATVDFIGNFDNSQQEPVVLPAQLPILLLNGCSGIAVGMATNIPPHNVSELVDGLVALIDRPQLSDHELWRLIPGPDFPTGGEIVDATGIYTAYQTGRGSIPVRGIATVETLNVGRRRRKMRQAIVVTELPFQVNKSSWIEKVANLVNNGNLTDIADIRDESDRGGMRVVIELKRDGDPELILSKLYKQTALQSNFGVILLAIVDNQPRQLSLRQCLNIFLDFREQTLRRQYRHDLGNAQQRIHLVEGLLKALNHLDEAIEILRHAPDGTTAKVELQAQLGLSEAQADALLAMPMRRLTGLERQKLQAEFEDLQQQIARLEQLLNERRELLKDLKKSLRSLKRQYKNPRRTRLPDSRPFPDPLPEPTPSQPSASTETPLFDSAPTAQTLSASERTNSLTPTSTDNTPLDTSSPSQTPEIPAATPTPSDGAKQDSNKDSNGATAIASMPSTTTSPHQPSAVPAAKVITPTAKSRSKPAPELTLFEPQYLPPDAHLEVNHQGAIYWRLPGSMAAEQGSESWPIFRAPRQQAEALMAIADNGKAYSILLSTIATNAPQPLVDLLPYTKRDPVERCLQQFFYAEWSEPQELILMTEQGQTRRVGRSQLQSLPAKGLSLIKLKRPDRLQYAQFCHPTQEVAIATNGGRILRFMIEAELLTPAESNRQGVPALRLRSNEILVGCVCGNEEAALFLLTQQGYGKQIMMDELRLSHRGDIGTQALRFAQTNDQLAAMVGLPDNSQFLVRTSQLRWLPLNVNQIPTAGKEAVGDRIVDLAPQETITQLLTLPSFDHPPST